MGSKPIQTPQRHSSEGWNPAFKPSLVIFDNDGVLVDSEPLIKQAQVIAFASQGAHITPEWSYINLHGLRASDVVQKVSHYTGVNINEKECLDVFKEAVSELFHKHLKPTPHITSLLTQLKDANIPICVATSGPLLETYLKLEVTGLDKFFPRETIFSGEQVPNGKPAPDLFLFAAHNMKYSAPTCCVIEDAPFGIIGAKAANMTAFGYLGGSHVQHTQDLSPETLLGAGADKVYHSHQAFPLDLS